MLSKAQLSWDQSWKKITKTVFYSVYLLFSKECLSSLLFSWRLFYANKRNQTLFLIFDKDFFLQIKSSFSCHIRNKIIFFHIPVSLWKHSLLLFVWTLLIFKSIFFTWFFFWFLFQLPFPYFPTKCVFLWCKSANHVLLYWNFFYKNWMPKLLQ